MNQEQRVWELLHAHNLDRCRTAKDVHQLLVELEEGLHIALLYNRHRRIHGHSPNVSALDDQYGNREWFENDLDPARNTIRWIDVSKKCDTNDCSEIDIMCHSICGSEYQYLEARIQVV